VKLLTYGRTRDEAIVRMQRALHEMVVDGIRTNIPLHQAILAADDFRAGRLSTRFLERLPYTAATLAKG
jgi:acetyl-CoA carboxylase biotin carboxylase subunit